MINRTLLLIAIFGLSACSGEDQEAASEDHVFKEMTETIDKAREVENLLQDAAKKQKAATE